jgi:hypothetical protein
MIGSIRRFPSHVEIGSIARGRSDGVRARSAVLLLAVALAGCSDQGDDAGAGGTMSPPETGGAGASGGFGGAGAGGAGGAGTAGGGAGGVAGEGSGGISSGGMSGAPAGAAGDGAGTAGSSGDAGAGGVGGQAGSAGQAGAINLPPENLSETGLFTGRDTNGELIPSADVRPFEPTYWLWSDGADKRRYVYLPPGSQIDTTDADHWVFPMGTKFWKSFISNGQLVETRMIERTDETPSGFRFSTYYWPAADAPDALRMDYEEQWLNAVGTTHDIPNGNSCELCHNSLEDRVLGFSALQLNHGRPGVTLQSLLDEGLLTVPISTSIGMPGSDQLTQDALGYLHANCSNCHNDSPGLPLETIPEPQMYLRVLVGDLTLEDTGTYKTAINQLATASADLGLQYRILGGSPPEESAAYYRMSLRMSEGDHMPPIGSEDPDTDEGLPLIASFIASLPAPTP